MEQRFIDAAKKYWREEGYNKGAVKSIAELLERISELEKKVDSYRWESELKEWK